MIKFKEGITYRKSWTERTATDLHLKIFTKSQGTYAKKDAENYSILAEIRLETSRIDLHLSSTRAHFIE